MVKVTGMETLTCRIQFLNDLDPFEITSLFPEPPRAPSYSFNIHLPLINQIATIHRILSAPHKLDDATLQIYKDGDYGAYLDLEGSINEQSEEFDSFLTNRKNSIVLRTQLPVRVNAIIEKLLTADGRELRRALFSLKQIFQEDKDLVHEFVENGGLSCLIKVGSEADQNYQNYILRALGQVMLYVDGMYGVMRHNETIQWLYSLVESKFRLVQKTALKLLLVFVDYVETNCLLLVEAISTVDSLKGSPLWSSVMGVLREGEGGDTELLVYAMSLVNKVLNGIPDIDTYYDQVDALEEQGMAQLIQKYMGKQCADLDLLQQLQIYEVVLKHEDGEEDIMMQLDAGMRQKLLNRKGYIELTGGGTSSLASKKCRRKSRRHSSSTSLNSSSLDLNLSSINSSILTNKSSSSSSSSTISSSSSNYSSHDHSTNYGTLDSTNYGTLDHGTNYGTNGSTNYGTVDHGTNYGTHNGTSYGTDGHGTNFGTHGSTNYGTRHHAIRRLSSAEDSCSGSGSGRRDSDEWSGAEDGSSIHSSSPAPSTGSSTSSPLIIGIDTYSSVDVGITPGLRKRRERAEHERSIGTEFDKLLFNSDPPHPIDSKLINEDDTTTEVTVTLPLLRSGSTKREIRPWALPIYPTPELGTNCNNSPKSPEINSNSSNNEVEEIVHLKRENTVKDLTQKLSGASLSAPQTEEGKNNGRTGDISGLIWKAKEGLAKSKSKVELKVEGTTPPSNSSSSNEGVKKSDNELQWDFLVTNLSRSLTICDLDFTELGPEDDSDVISPHQICSFSVNGSGPPPPLMPSTNGHGPPPPPPSGAKFNNAFGPPPPPLITKSAPPPPLFGISLKHSNGTNNTSNSNNSNNTLGKKSKKTVKLFWKEVREDPVTASKIEKLGSIWDEMLPIPLDTSKLEHLFESRAKDVINKKTQEVNKFKEIVVLDPKRSNAINIGMTKLPPPRTIKTAIMKMDATIINREGIEKLLTMLPTDEERAKIQEAQFANPETPLGNAEQFLLTLASISELTPRLKLWAFKLDYEHLEKEIAEPLMDLKLGISSLQSNKTFKNILGTLLCIGNFLNGAEAKGFQIEYLAKVPEVKDTVHKHSLLHHLCHTVIEKFPESNDLYSEIGAVTRASRVDFDELAGNLVKMETECKASWDYLRLIAKHDGPTNMKLKMSEFLADCAERIIVLGIIHRRVINRFHKFLIWLGVSAHQVTTTKPQSVFKIISEFALEYRTTRERVLQQLQKKASHRERNKTRGKMITELKSNEVSCGSSSEDRADAELLLLLKSPSNSSENETKVGSSSWGRRSKFSTTQNNSLPSSLSTHNYTNSSTKNPNNTLNSTLNRSSKVGGDGDDEILESLVKTATQMPGTRTAPRDRKRTNSSRLTERKSLRRTLRHGLSEEERKLLASFMANGHSFDTPNNNSDSSSQQNQNLCLQIGS